MKHARIFYCASDTSQPSGGEKHTYEHVDLLNAAGFSAYALHSRRGYRHTWFENTTPVIDFGSLWDMYDREHDYIVLPETAGTMITSFPGKKVIFNKNIYHGFDSFGRSEEAFCSYTDRLVMAILTVSDHSRKHLQFTFPCAKVFRMYCHVDCNLFRFMPLIKKRQIIACVAKEKQQVAMLRQILMSRNRLHLNRIGDYRWLLLEGLSEREMADTLQDAVLTVSLCVREGLGRTLIEAMACGSLVLGLGVGSLKESLPVNSQVEAEDFIALAERIEQIVADFPDDIEKWQKVASDGRAAAEQFTQARQKEHLLAAWAAIMSA